MADNTPNSPQPSDTEGRENANSRENLDRFTVLQETEGADLGARIYDGDDGVPTEEDAVSSGSLGYADNLPDPESSDTSRETVFEASGEGAFAGADQAPPTTARASRANSSDGVSSAAEFYGLSDAQDADQSEGVGAEGQVVAPGDSLPTDEIGSGEGSRTPELFDAQGSSASGPAAQDAAQDAQEFGEAVASTLTDEAATQDTGSGAPGGETVQTPPTDPLGEDSQAGDTPAASSEGVGDEPTGADNGAGEDTQHDAQDDGSAGDGTGDNNSGANGSQGGNEGGNQGGNGNAYGVNGHDQLDEPDGAAADAGSNGSNGDNGSQAGNQGGNGNAYGVNGHDQLDEPDGAAADAGSNGNNGSQAGDNGNNGNAYGVNGHDQLDEPDGAAADAGSASAPNDALFDDMEGMHDGDQGWESAVEGGGADQDNSGDPMWSDGNEGPDQDEDSFEVEDDAAIEEGAGLEGDHDLSALGNENMSDGLF